MDVPFEEEEEEEELEDVDDANDVPLLLPKELLFAEVGVVILFMPPLGGRVEFWRSALFGLLGDEGTWVLGAGGTWGGCVCVGVGGYTARGRVMHT